MGTGNIKDGLIKEHREAELCYKCGKVIGVMGQHYISQPCSECRKKAKA